MTTYQALAHVWTPDYQYWNPVGKPELTYEDAAKAIQTAADKFWPGDSNPSRRAAFISRCKIVESST